MNVYEICYWGYTLLLNVSLFSILYVVKSLKY